MKSHMYFELFPFMFCLNVLLGNSGFTVDKFVRKNKSF